MQPMEQAFKELKDPPDLSPGRCTDRSAHPGRLRGLQPAGDAQAMATTTGAGAGARVCAGQDGGGPNRQRASAHDRWPTVLLSRYTEHEPGSRAAAAATEDRFTCPTVAKDILWWGSDREMTSGVVVPTF
jgi:hypothetical protein